MTPKRVRREVTAGGISNGGRQEVASCLPLYAATADLARHRRLCRGAIICKTDTGDYEVSLRADIPRSRLLVLRAAVVSKKSE